MPVAYPAPHRERSVVPAHWLLLGRVTDLSLFPSTNRVPGWSLVHRANLSCDWPAQKWSATTRVVRR